MSYDERMAITYNANHTSPAAFNTLLAQSSSSPGLIAKSRKLYDPVDVEDILEICDAWDAVDVNELDGASCLVVVGGV